MLFVSYAQPLSLAAHTAGAALIEDFNEKDKSLLKSKIKDKAVPSVCAARDNGCA